jgi:hypothetical protein
VERRVSDGKTRREAIRCLKRYVTREIYRTITAQAERGDTSVSRLTSMGASAGAHTPRPTNYDQKEDHSTGFRPAPPEKSRPGYPDGFGDSKRAFVIAVVLLFIAMH